MARQFEAFRRARLEAVNTRYADHLAKGFTVEFDGQAETLQCRSDVDRCNWLAMHSMCMEAISAGMGDELIPVGFRCTSNRSYAVTFSEALGVLQGLRTWAAMAQANWWRLKDAVRDCTSREALKDIDLDEGWP